MALKSIQVSVGASTPVNLLATLSNKASINDQTPVLIRNLQAQAGTTCWLGGPDVSSSNGMPLFGQESLPLGLLQSDTPYAIADSGTITVAVLVGRQS